MIEDPNTLVSIQRVELNKLDLVVPLFDKYRVFYKKESDVVSAQKFLSERLLNKESVIFLALLTEQYNANWFYAIISHIFIGAYV